VWKKRYPAAPRPDEKWTNFITDLFRGVDCANPSVDFEGCLIIGSAKVINKFGMNPSDYIQIIG